MNQHTRTTNQRDARRTKHFTARQIAGLAAAGLVLLLAGSAAAARYGFETGAEGWQPLNWDPGCTNVAQSTFWGYGGSAHSLRMDLDLVAAGDKGWANVTFPAAFLQGSQISMRVYCPAGASGTNPELWARTQLTLWARDADFHYQETTWDAFRIPPGISTQYVYLTVTGAGGFDSTNVTEFGLRVYWQGYGAYHGPLYIDEAGFGPAYQIPVITNIQYDFEIDEDGFGPTDDPGNLAVTSVVRSTEITAAHSNACLKLNANLNGNDSTRDAGEAWVDLQTCEPVGAPVPVDLEGKEVAIYAYCPPGSRGPESSPNGVRVFVKDDEWRAEYGTWAPVVEGSWQKLVLIPATTAPTNGHMDPDFDPHAIRAVGLNFAANSTSSVYAGPIYMDAVCIQTDPMPAFTPPAFEKYSFDTSDEGWEISTDTASAGLTNVARVT
ncbi:MAG: hypothetical protein JXB04_10750, partial [Kiritimatiellae bacterium]|nr:hypothetical protein [Kiritimatiellia bacterium]